MNKKILIIGGMGPQASINLHKKIVDKVSKSGAENADQHPTIMHFSLPIPEFIDSHTNRIAGVAMIKELLYSLWRP